MNEEFEKWINDNNETWVDLDEHEAIPLAIRSCWDTAWNHQQAKIDAQDKKIKALQKFVIDIRDNYIFSIGADDSYHLFKKHKMIDENGKPTKLLAD